MQNYIDFYKIIHKQSHTYGTNCDPGAPIHKIHELVKDNTNVLDYGCRKGVLVEYLNQNNIKCTGYDPSILKYSEHKQYTNNYDCLVCLDVLEHIHINEIDNILEDISLYNSDKYIFNIALRPAVQQLPNGENAHLIVESKEWWSKKLKTHLNSYTQNTISYKENFNLLISLCKFEVNPL